MVDFIPKKRHEEDILDEIEKMTDDSPLEFTTGGHPPQFDSEWYCP